MYHKSKSSSTNVSKPPPLTSHLLLRGGWKSNFERPTPSTRWLICTQKGEMSGARSRTVLLVEFMESHKFSTLWHVGLAGPCGAARKNKVPTRADLCYGVVDREIVATKCA